MRHEAQALAMHYIGGKQKSGGAQIAKLVNSVVKHYGLSTICEPFCGGLSVTSRLDAPQVFASDACTALITLYKAICDGWTPPDLVTREQWAALRDTQDPADPMTAFAGFGCSRSGNWFSGFSDREKRTGNHYVPSALAARESLQNKLRRCDHVEFAAHDYREAGSADLYYCDPPYEGTLAYPAVAASFDHDAFWKWARAISARKMVAVSERTAPNDFVPLLTFSLQNRLVNGTPRRTEHLFVHESQLKRWQVCV